MAIIGFLFLVVLGLYFLWVTLGGTYVQVLFTEKFPLIYFIVTGAIAFGLLYAAYVNAPFKLVVA